MNEEEGGECCKLLWLTFSYKIINYFSQFMWMHDIVKVSQFYVNFATFNLMLALR